MWIARLVLALYFSMLTLLLLVPDPAGLLGLRRVPRIGGGLGTHFMAFLILGSLVVASRLPARRMWALVPVAVYAVGIELAQSFFPPRRVQWEDLLENLAGLALGVAIGHAALWLATRRGAQRPNP